MGFHSKPTPTIAEGFPVSAAGVRALSQVPGVDCIGRLSLNLTANRIYYCPFFVSRAIAIDELSCGVAGAQAGQVRLGIYRADLRWQPTDLVIDAGTIDSGSTGAKVISLVPDIVLPAGRYLFAMTSGSTPGMRTIHGGSRYAALNEAHTTSSFVHTLHVARAFGVLPDPGVEWTDVDYGASSLQQLVRVRISDPAP